MPCSSCSRLPCLLLATVFLCQGCSDGDPNDRCGPRRALVTRVIDGDTVEIEGGERVRLLMVDTPETTGGATDCYGPEATQFTRSLLEGREVELRYDVECEDRYGRLLAYVFVDGREINILLVERGYACVLYIPPNGTDRRTEFETLEYLARTGGVGMWGACAEVTCAN